MGFCCVGGAASKGEVKKGGGGCGSGDCGLMGGKCEIGG